MSRPEKSADTLLAKGKNAVENAEASLRNGKPTKASDAHAASASVSLSLAREADTDNRHDREISSLMSRIAVCRTDS
jgi:hypothetical protein